jgi:uncharacterized membrane protein
MATIVSGVFPNPSMAAIAVERLRELGVTSSDISMIAREVERVAAEPVGVETTSATAAGVATGGVFGGLAGLLVGLGTLAIPGIGPVIAAGPLLGALGGAAIGAATGGLVGALVDLGVPEEYATTYATEIERGQVLVTVRTDVATPTQVREVLASAGALHLYPPTTALV